MEVVTGYLTHDQMEEEIGAISHLLHEFHRMTAIITFGGGCDWAEVDSDNRPTVACSSLSDFFGELEAKGIFKLGHCDLVIDSEDGAVQFVLCECSDIHCKTDDLPFFETICMRWAELFYPHAYELDQVNRKRQQRFLASKVWTPFDE